MISRTFLRAAGLSAAAIVVGALANPAQASCDPGETVFRFHHTAAARDNARGEAAATLARRINREFDGRACMTVRPRATDHTEATLPEALAEGRFEIGAISTGSLGAISPRFLVFDLPFLFDDVEAVLAFQASATGRDLLEEAARAGMTGLAYLLDGFDQIAAARPVTAPTDLEGIRFATGGSPLDRATFSLIGAEPVGPEAAEAETEARDGTWSDLRSEGVARRDYGLTGTNHTVEQYVLVAGRDRWRSLDPELRAELERVIIEVAHERNRLAFELNAAAKHIMKSRGVALRDLGPIERLAWKRAMQEVWFGYGGEIGFDQISTALYVNRRAQGGVWR